MKPKMIMMNLQPKSLELSKPIQRWLLICKMQSTFSIKAARRLQLSTSIIQYRMCLSASSTKTGKIVPHRIAGSHAAFKLKFPTSAMQKQWKRFKQESLWLCPSHQSLPLMKLAYRSTQTICAHASMIVVRCLWSKVALSSQERSLAINSLSTKECFVLLSKNTKLLSRSSWSCMKRSAKTSKWGHQRSDLRAVTFVSHKSSPSCKT